MAFELSVYEETKQIIAHTLTCTTISSQPRKYQSGPMVRITPGWKVIRCERCNPAIYVVHVTSKSLRGESYRASHVPVENPRGPDGPNFATKHSISEWRRSIRRDNPESDFPPYGVEALDARSINRFEWWKEAECNSDDERLGTWLRDLFQGDHNEHWSQAIQKVICSQCPVRAECLEQGVWGYEAWGIWGGANDRERKFLRAKWLREGRVDERPNRPRNPISGTDSAFHSRLVRSEDGSRVATESDDDGHGDSEEPGESQEAGDGMPEVPVTQEVRWPRSYRFAGSGWSSEGSGRG